MTIYLTDPEIEARLHLEREAQGADRYDEVWEGVYMIASIPNDEHQDLVALLTSIFVDVVRWTGLGEVRAGVNVSREREHWKEDYRVPDVAVFLSNGQAVNLGTHWLGGPDLVIEILSPHDRSRDKLSFYGDAGVEELLMIDRQPWRLEFYELVNRGLKLRETSDVSTGNVISSQTVPLTFRLLAGEPRPEILVSSTTSEKTWSI